MVIDPVLGWSLRLLAKLGFKYVGVGVAEVCVVICGINHVKGEVVWGSGDRVVAREAALTNLPLELVPRSSIHTYGCQCGC